MEKEERMKYKWIIFDADETLFHFDNFAGLRYMFAKHDIAFEQQDYDEYQTVNKQLWVEYQNNQITAEQLQTRRFKLWSDRLKISPKDLNKQFLESMAEICQTLPGATDLVKYLFDNNVRMAIITNGFVQLQQIRLERTECCHIFHRWLFQNWLASLNLILQSSSML